MFIQLAFNWNYILNAINIFKTPREQPTSFIQMEQIQSHKPIYDVQGAGGCLFILSLWFELFCILLLCFTFYLFFYSLILLFVMCLHLDIYLYISLFIYSFNHYLFIYLVIYLLIYSFIHSLTHVLIHLLIYLFICLFLSLINSIFIYSYIYFTSNYSEFSPTSS